MKLIRRSLNPHDSPFIYSSLCNSLYYQTRRSQKINSRQKFFNQVTEYLKDLLSEGAKVLLLSIQDDPATILGYAVLKGTILEWIYIKEDLRKQGLARNLLLNIPLTDYNKQNLTPIGRAILNSHPDIFETKENKANLKSHLKEETKENLTNGTTNTSREPPKETN